MKCEIEIGMFEIVFNNVHRDGIDLDDYRINYDYKKFPFELDDLYINVGRFPMVDTISLQEYLRNLAEMKFIVDHGTAREFVDGAVGEEIYMARRDV